MCTTLAVCFSLPAVIPKVTKHLLSNPVFTCIILAACMEIAVVAGFAAFLGKYLEQQFNLTTSSANQLLGESVPPSSWAGGAGLLTPVVAAVRIPWGPPRGCSCGCSTRGPCAEGFQRILSRSDGPSGGSC